MVGSIKSHLIPGHHFIRKEQLSPDSASEMQMLLFPVLTLNCFQKAKVIFLKVFNYV